MLSARSGIENIIMNSEIKNCQNCKEDFIIEPDDFVFYRKMEVPTPTFCWKCRYQRRISYRNEHKAFFNTSLKSGKKVFSLYSKQSKIPIYSDQEWNEDDWDAMQYGLEYNFAKTFFEQFHNLATTVPRWSSSCDISNLRSEFIANSDDAKDSYLVFNTSYMEGCAYGIASFHCKECFDVTSVSDCERSYELFWSMNCYRTHFSAQCNDCTNVLFSKNCKGCMDCFGCVNLRNKSHYIFNVPYSKDEYEQKIKSFSLNTWGGLMIAKEEAREFWVKFPVKYMQGANNQNVLGEYISHSRNIFMGYFIHNGENLRYCQHQLVPGAKDSMDISIWGSPNELCYENTTCGYGCSNSKFCVECWPENNNLEYCMFMKNSSYCFGCFGLGNKQYCIFNKQYTKDKYFELVKKIKKQMDEMPYVDKKGRVYKYGEFFPMEHSAFEYNTSIVNEYFPLTREKATEEGCSWDDSEKTEYDVNINASELPDSINDVEDNIVSKLIACNKCERAYRIIKSELDFLKAEKLPLPRLCVDCRYLERVSQRHYPFLFHRKCMCDKENHNHNGKCLNEFETSYAPDKPEIVYCEKCYNEEVA
jgi:hypothetical protein